MALGFGFSQAGFWVNPCLVVFWVNFCVKSWVIHQRRNDHPVFRNWVQSIWCTKKLNKIISASQSQKEGSNLADPKVLSLKFSIK